MRVTEAKEHPQKVGNGIGLFPFLLFHKGDVAKRIASTGSLPPKEELAMQRKNSEVNSEGEDRHTAVSGSIRKTFHRCQGHCETWSGSTLQSHAQLEMFG